MKVDKEGKEGKPQEDMLWEEKEERDRDKKDGAWACCYYGWRDFIRRYGLFTYLLLDSLWAVVVVSGFYFFSQEELCRYGVNQ